jgi:mRNA interferase RelE/StbE
MIYKLKFIPSAEKEWNKLDNSVKQQLKKTLEKRLKNPCVPKDKMRNTALECYKIKLRTIGIRLVYAVVHGTVSLIVISIGKRENNEVYESLDSRISELTKSMME